MKNEPINTPEVNVEQDYLKAILATGYSMGQIATELGLSYSTIQKLVKGESSKSYPSTFRRILILYCRLFYNNGNDTVGIS